MQIEDIRTFFRDIDQLCLRDPGMIALLASNLEAQAPTLFGSLTETKKRRQKAQAVFPAINLITAAQLTIYDNWTETGGRKPSRKKGEKGARKVRYKAVLSVWTTPEGVKVSAENTAFSAMFYLMEDAERFAKLAEYRNPKKSKGSFVIVNGERDPAWSEFDAILSSDFDGLLGPAQVLGGNDGTQFALNVFALCDNEALDQRDAGLKVAVYNDGENLTFHNFVDHYAGRGENHKLPGNAILTSRLALPSHHVQWRTGLLSCPTVEGK